MGWREILGPMEPPHGSNRSHRPIGTHGPRCSGWRVPGRMLKDQHIERLSNLKNCTNRPKAHGIAVELQYTLHHSNTFEKFQQLHLLAIFMSDLFQLFLWCSACVKLSFATATRESYMLKDEFSGPAAYSLQYAQYAWLHFLSSATAEEHDCTRGPSRPSIDLLYFW